MAARVLPSAEADIRGTALFIAQDNPRAARAWAERIRERCRRLGETPGIGAPRPEVAPDLRILPVGNTLIVYRQVSDDAEVVRVLHGARQWQDPL